MLTAIWQLIQYVKEDGMKKLIILLLAVSFLVSVTLNVPYFEAVKKVVKQVVQWVKPAAEQIPSQISGKIAR